MTPKERFLNACFGKPVDRPPVWMMRQAGRYLPEYRAIRARRSTLEMMTTPELACEITLQPVRLLGVDAAILYSDILMVPDAMGAGLDFQEGVGPVFARYVRCEADLAWLSQLRIQDHLAYVYKTIGLLRAALSSDFPLLGFVGAPFTVATYMVGAKGAHDCIEIKRMAEESPETLEILLAQITQATIAHVLGQVEAGVDAIQLFDTWAGVLSVADYQKWALPHTQAVLAAVNRTGVPTILYVKGGGPYLECMRAAHPSVVGLDWRGSLPEARRRLGPGVAIQGNLDPAHLYAPVERIKVLTEAMIRSNGNQSGYIVNLGHGILPDIPLAHARAFIETAKRVGAGEA